MCVFYTLHFDITFTVEISVDRQRDQNVSRMQFHKAAWSKYRRILQFSQWNHAKDTDVDASWAKCLNDICYASSVCIPTEPRKSLSSFNLSRVRTASRHCRRLFSVSKGRHLFLIR